MSCNHAWREKKKLSDNAYEVSCVHCESRAVAKPRFHKPNLHEIENEVICQALITLLLGKCGINHHPPKFQYMPSFSYVRDSTPTGPWTHPHLIMEWVESSGRAVKGKSTAYVWPTWLFYFDRWVGRLDGDSANNLLIGPERKIIPIDFFLAFPWANDYPPDYMRTSDTLRVHYRSETIKSRDLTVKKVLAEITKEEILKTLREANVSVGNLLPMSTLVAYWSGLVSRKGRV